MDEAFLDLSARLGCDPLLVQGAGGNTSVKHNGTMWVKASGKWLAHAHEKNAFLSVDLAALRACMAADDEQTRISATFAVGSLRPSIETPLHAALPHRIVLHAHPVDVLARAVTISGEHYFAQRLAGVSWTWIEYARPGLDLTRAVTRALRGQAVDVLILANHGIVVGGEDCAEAGARLDRVVAAVRQNPREDDNRPTRTILKRALQLGMRLSRHAVVQGLGLDPISFELCKQPPLYPDQVVFLGPQLMLVRVDEDPLAALNRLAETHSKQPEYLIWESHGVLVAPTAPAMVDEMLLGHAELLRRVPQDARLRALSALEIERLLDWDAELYRQSLNR